jgi:mannose-6-phosphate isomerase-like protein (cupin superfamily)
MGHPGFVLASKCATREPTINLFSQEDPMSTTRREILFLFSGIISSAVASEGLPSPGPLNQDSSLPSATYPFGELPVSKANGVEIRSVLKGKLATSESLEVHETTLPPGAMPHAPHHHVHSEMWLIREGAVQLTINGTSHVMGPGSVGFVHSNDEHGIKNIGTTPATYFVVAVGPGADAQ